MTSLKHALSASAAALILSCTLSQAIDPLPAELDNAPLAKKNAFWEKMGRDSGELKHKVAIQRHEQAMVYKKALLNNIEEESHAAQARLAAASSPEAAAAIDEEAGVSSFGTYAMIALIIGGGSYFMYRQIRQSEQPV